MVEIAGVVKNKGDIIFVNHEKVAEMCIILGDDYQVVDGCLLKVSPVDRHEELLINERNIFIRKEDAIRADKIKRRKKVEEYKSKIKNTKDLFDFMLTCMHEKEQDDEAIKAVEELRYELL